MNLAAIELVARGGSHGPRFLFPLTLLLLLLLFGGWFLRQRRNKPGTPKPGSPLQTLQERFARGEINRAEFEHRKAVLLGEEAVPPAPEPPMAPPTSPPTFVDSETPDETDEDE